MRDASCLPPDLLAACDRADLANNALSNLDALTDALRLVSGRLLDGHEDRCPDVDMFGDPAPDPEWAGFVAFHLNLADMVPARKKRR